MNFTCEHCKKSFVRESTFAIHMCEPRRRRMEKDERGVQMGLQAYLKFFELMHGSAKLKTFDDFAESPYYRAFVKFGRYCIDIKAINPVRFIEWLLKKNKKIDHWCRDSIYTEYLIDYLITENVGDALARAIEYGIAWEEQTGNPAHDCLRYGNTNAVIYAISIGKISPWIIYNCESGQKLLENLTEDQIKMIWPYVDADSWQKKFRDNLADQEYAKEILRKAGW